MRSVCQVLSKQERLQVASEGGTVEIRVSQFIRQCIPSCRRSHGKGTTTIYLFSWNLGATSKLRLAERRCCRSATWADGLLVKLSNAGVGCFWSFFVGGLAYADDLVLLSPSPTAMRKMFSICDEYAAELSIKFNANKSKWLAIIPRKHRWLASHLTFCQFHVEDHHITRVSSFTHLGHIINSELLTKRR